MPTQDTQLDAVMKERFAALPKVVQDAITSADVQEHLRALADTHKLHLDQWTALENEVMLTLLGFQSTESITENIKKEVGVDDATAASLAGEISKFVFEPIRGELERNLDHPEAKEESVSAVDAVRTQVLATEKQNALVQPATPPPAPTTEKAERAALPAAYTSSASHERKEIAGDPYREQIT